MKHIVIGTAGHIDHGKTALIRALTGRDTDRLKEEKQRGITIDLGFTWFDMEDGSRAGIIDVPGHERFVPHMAAGVVGMDLVLLVVAADEGVMPQTREHADILGLLGVTKCIIVLNKCDLVEEEWRELACEEIREEFAGTFLADAPIVPVSAVTGEGLSRLREAIAQMAKETAPRETASVPRLPIDRVFTISGFGTVVTGTLLSGAIAKEDVLEIYPTGNVCRVRGIQVHGEERERCEAGERTALNLSHIKKSEVYRGCVAAPVGHMRAADLLDVKLTVLPDSRRTLRNRERLHLFTGTSEVLCRAVLLDQEELPPGGEGLAQLILEQKVAARRGDRFLVRFYSPLETVGGGTILDANPRRKKRFHAESLAGLRRRESGSLADVIELTVREYTEKMVSLAELARRTAHTEAELAQYLPGLAESIYIFPQKKNRFLWHRDREFAVRQSICGDLRKYHEVHPYRFGRKKAEIRGTYLRRLSPPLFDAYLERMEAEGVFRCRGEWMALAEFSIVRDARFLAIADTLRTALAAAGYDFVRFSAIPVEVSREMAEDVRNVLLEDGEIVCLTDDFYTLRTLADDAQRRIQELLSRQEVITIGQVRDLLGSGRKNAKLLIEYMDRMKITKKTGGESERSAY